MNMIDWAKREIEIACKREAPGREDGEYGYGYACYESALKAYLSLMEDEHSGMSFGFTAGILKRLLESKPLTPIEDVPEVWGTGRTYGDDGVMHYQCKRMTSLFKNVTTDGKVSYNDVRRYYCEDEVTGATYTCGLESSILDELHPITMPYYPPIGYWVFTTRECLSDVRNGDFDTKAIITLKAPDGSVERIDRFYAEDGNGWRGIDFQEWSEREEADRHRRKQEAR